MIKRGLRLGDLDAETDSDLLSECFIDNGELELLQNTDKPESLIIGRTGAGKSALLMKIAEIEAKSKILDPHDISVRFLEHSDVIQFFQNLGVNLDLFYRLLWRHVLTIEFLKIRYDLKCEDDSKTVWRTLTSLVERDEVKKQALSYFKEWGGKFWLETDQQVKEITEKLSRDIKAGFDSNLSDVNISLEGSKLLSQERKSEIVHRANKVVSEIQIKRLAGVLDLLEDKVFDDYQKKYFILLDKLDEEWADTETRYRFVRALIEEIKTFRNIKSVKIIVSLRKDLLDTVYDKTRGAGFQQEKYESYLVPIHWSRDALKLMIESRINEVFKRQYTKSGIKISDIFPPPKKGGGVKAIDYILDRTLLRPRDVLQFSNECFALSIDKTKISWRSMYAAETNYSEKRLNSMLEEWESLYPALNTTIEVLRGAPSSFTRSFISDQLEVISSKLLDHLDDPCGSVIFKYLDSDSKTIGEFDVIAEIVSCLFRVGAIAIKTSKTTPYIWSDFDNATLSKSQVKRVEHIKVHKMLHNTLGIAS